MNWDTAIGIIESAPSHLAFKDKYRWLARNGEFRHPDLGGTDAGFRQLNDAYQRVSGMPPAAGSWKADADTLFGDPKVNKEALFQSKIKGLLEKEGAFVFNCHGGGMQRAGMPDIWVQHLKWDGWIELKTDRRKLESLQEVTIEKIRKRGGCAQVWRLRGNTVTFQVPESGIGIRDVMEILWPISGEGLLEAALEVERRMSL